jgi:hypothetical protein
VSVGGTAATGVTVVNGTTITATTAAHAAGTVNVVVTNTDAQSGTLTNGYTYTTSTGGGPIAFVQLNYAVPSAPSASVPVTYTLAQTAGNLNIVAVGWNDTTSTVSTISDTRGNTYTLAVGPTTGTGLRQSIYYAKNIAAGSNTITVTFNQAAPYVDVRIFEYSGLDASNPLDVTAGAVGTSTSASSGAATTTSANELIFGAGTTAGSFNNTGSPGFVVRVLTNPNADIGEDKTVSSTGSYSAVAGLFSSRAWVMQMATFRASGQGSGGNPAPTVTSISPTSGTTLGGTAVSISGTGFLAGATVSVGGTAATGVTVVNSTTITATTAAHAAGTVSVVVTNTDGKSGILTIGYTYVVINPAPTVTSISPASGTTAGGAAVSITGAGFLGGATVKLGGTAATGVTVVNSTTISATTPAHIAGAVSVIVTNTDSQSGTLAGGYTYTNPAPSVVSVAPNSGTANGGTALTITGTGILAGATVKLGGTAATGVTVVNSTTITATTPVHTTGAVNVVVTNTDAQSGTLTNGYTYTANLALGVFAGDPSSATVIAGQTATYTLSLGGGGMSGSATLTCAGAPAHATCAIPASQTFDAVAATPVSVTVKTTSRTIAAVRPPHSAPASWSWNLAMAMLGIVILPGIRIGKRPVRRYLWLPPLTLCLLLASCGGGGSTGSNSTGGQPANPNGTPAGTYTVNVTAISGSATQTIPLTLIVQ